MSPNKETPAGQGEGFEIAARPIPEENPNMDIIADAANAGETLAEWDARDRAEQDAWLAAHPEARAAKPEWADTVCVHEEFDGSFAIAYERTFGHVLLSRWALWESGVVRFPEGTTEPEVVVLLRDDPLTVAQMRELAGNLLAATPMVETAQVQP